jgi:2,3-bisphosphoglycerate-independent phosphoglycerate mutase
LTASLQKARLHKPQVKFIFKSTIQHRAVLVLRGPKLSTAVSDSDPEKVGVKVSEIEPLDKSPEAKRTAEILNELTAKFRKVLETHPVNRERIKRKLPEANFILCRGAGTVPSIKPISEIYGIKGVCVAAAALVKGVCKAAGMKLVNVKGATGTPQTDFMAKAKATVQALESSDFVVLHVKATDAVSHDGDYEQKIRMIEKFDGMMGYMLDNLDLSTTYLAVTTDHTTSCITRNHEGDPVPVAITGPQVRRDGVEEFDERTCSKGGLNRIRGMDLMPILMNLIGKAKKFGA